MRIFPILLAAAVAALLYGVVIERDRLTAVLTGAPPPQVPADPPASPAADAAPATGDAGTPDAASAGPAGRAPIAVMATRSTAQEIDSAVILRGETAPMREVEVMAETTGRVVSGPLRKGARVAAGDVLCELDPGTRQVTLEEVEAALAEARARVPEARARVPEAEARVAEAEAALSEARINANAADALSGQGFASEVRVAGTLAAVRSAEAAVSSAEAGLEAARSGMQGASARIRAAEAAVARAEDEIAKLTVAAPFAGVLETDTAELGALLQSGGMGGAPCARVLELDPIKLVGYVPETDLGRMENGAPATARLTGGGEVAGEVVFVSRQADETTRTFRIEIEVPNPDLALSAGQTAEIAVSAAGVTAHLLPASALTLDDAGTLGVRVVSDDGTARFVPVSVLRDTPRGMWLTGLPKTAEVITVGQEYVTDGVPVAPSFQEVIQ